ncbi:hypothetical protein EDD18DRAFT_266928 [Armillaria luteobubalina]|uniref:Uncharacterized protein n=1 Tax=Armillaria luteobubalina TaxID=153913 RepID=A0AA39Q352_9AGAR|nr:hypothetical protein EDD18DRAFT_266928 [Armillaria luteobubalina]
MLPESIGGGSESIKLEGQTVDVQARTSADIQTLSPACDEDIYHSWESSLSGSLQDSHVLLAACNHMETAIEVNGIDIFMDALLTCMKNKPTMGILTYASLLHRLNMPYSQTPHFDGKHIRQHLFDSWESPADSSMILCCREEDHLVLSAGSLHGIAVKSTFVIYGTDLSDSHDPLATAVVKTVEAFISCLYPASDKDHFFTACKDAPQAVWYARLDKASGASLAIYCNDSPFLDNLLKEDCESRLIVPAIPAKTQPEADLCLTVKDSTVYFDWGGKSTIISASMGFPSRFSFGAGIKDITTIHRVIDCYSQFNSHLTRPGSPSLPISEYISIEMHELRINKGSLSPTGGNLLLHSEEKPVQFHIDRSSEEKRYGFTIRNTSSIALYTYLFYFDASTLTIAEWYSPDLSNGKKNNAIDTSLLPGSTLTLGFRSGSMEPVQFLIPDGQEVDLCFFKIFVTKKGVDFGSISQLSPFTNSIGRGATLVPPPVTDDWGSRTIPIVLKRAETFQSSSSQSSDLCSKKQSTKHADYMDGLEKWLTASLQRLERFLSPFQPYAIPNQVLESGCSEWEKN